MSFRRSLQLVALQLLAITGLVAATSVVAYVVQPDSGSPSTTAPGRSAVAVMEAAASQLTVAPADSGVANPELRMLGRRPFDRATSTVVVAAPDRIPINFVIDTTTATTTPVTVTTAPVATTSPPAPTTTQPQAATTTPATTPPPPPSIGGSFGAASVGPGQEPATTEGTLVEGSNHVSAIEGASPGETILLRGGSYSGGFNVPPGVTVKPYNGESVTVSGPVTMSSNSVVAGLNVTSGGQWVIHVDSSSSAKQNVTIRNNAITGGSVETIRVSRNVKDVLISGNDLSGGGNHVIKVHGMGSGHAPSATIQNNRISNPQREDGIQTEDNGPVTIDRNTFSGTPENGVDVKSGQRVTITRNLFDGKTLKQAALLVHGRGDAVVTNNRFASGANVELGSRGTGDATMTFKGNSVEGGYISVRYSTRPVIIDGNVVSGGSLKLGISGGDHPRDARVHNNLFEGTELLDRVTQAGASWSCQGNTLVNVKGDWSKCS